MSSLEIHGVGKCFGSQPVLLDVTLSVEEHERIVLLGCSGAGKSTLLRVVAGLEQPDSGYVRFEERDLAGLNPRQRSVAMLGQDAALYPQQTVVQNVLAASRKLKLTRVDALAQARQILDQFGILSLEDKLPSQVSGGEAQRVALARALVARPKILLLDEPLSQLDGLMKESSMELLDQVHEEFRPTTIVVSHDPVDALQIGSRVAVLHQGRLVDLGESRRVYKSPRSRIAGELTSPFGMNWIDRGKLVDDLPEHVVGRYVGFRAEDARIVSPGEAAPNRCMQITLALRRVRYIGAGMLGVGEYAGHRIRVVSDALQTGTPQIEVAIPFEQLIGVDQ